ncbi:MAG: YybS family protein [Syntrophomonadaceae bacterium]|nr:YybS family protein [Syntrophomonadaceae bacterium]
MPFIKFFLSTSLLCLVLTKIDVLSFVFIIIWGTLLLLSALELPRTQVFLIFLLNMFIITWGMGLYAAYFYLAGFGLPVLVMCVFIAENKDYYTVRKSGLIAAAAGISLYLIIVYLLTGSIGIADFQAMLRNSVNESLEWYRNLGVLDNLASNGISEETLRLQLDSMAQTLPQYLPSYYYLQSLVTVFFTLLLTSRINMNDAKKRLNKQPYFLDIMPWQLVWLVIIALALLLWGRNHQTLAYLAGANALAIMVPIAIYFGFCSLNWRLKSVKASTRKWVVALIVILSIFFIPSALTFLALIGLFDSLIDYRKLRSRKGEKQ